MKKDLVLLAIIASRIFGIVLLFLIHPLIAIAINIALDSIDGPVYDYILSFGKIQNQMYDKVLDLAYYVALMILVLQLTLPFWQLLLVLFLYRCIGQFVFFVTQDKQYFTLYPNFFEYFTLAVLAVDLINPSDNLNRYIVTLSLFAIMTAFKLWSENFLHRDNKTFFQLFWIPLFKRLNFHFAYEIQKKY